MFIKTEPLPMTGSARDSLIAIAVLWVLFAVTVVFRFIGRIRGIGLGLDDILSAVALVSSPKPGSRRLLLTTPADLIQQHNRHECRCVYDWRWLGF
jgi:hypothetical protein